MAIIRGNKQGGPDRGYTNIVSGAPAAEASALIGAELKNTGKQIIAVQDTYLAAAKKATINAQYNTALRDATLQFSEKYADRLNKSTDDQGNPTYESLIGDVGTIGEEVLAKISANIKDPEAKMKFEATFAKNIGNKQIQAGREARNQHQDYVKASLSRGLEAQISLSLEDSVDNINQYHTEAERMISEALNAGAITQVEAQKLRSSTVSSIRKAPYHRMIDEDPKKALEQISLDTSVTGLTLDEKKDLVARAESAVRSLEFKAKMNEKALTDRERLQMQIEENKLSLQISNGDIREDQIIQAVQDKAINVKQAEGLLEELSKYEKKALKDANTSISIDKYIKGGVRPAGVSEADIDNHFRKASEAADAKTLSQRAAIAAKYRGPVKSFTGDLSNIARGGDSQQSEDALGAYRYSMIHSPEVLSKLNKSDRAVYAQASTLVEASSMSGAEAMKRARESVKEADDPIRAERRREFGKIKGFSSEKLQSTINDVFGLDSIFTREARLAPGVDSTMKRVLREGYELTGSEEGAKQFLKDWASDSYGVSTVNGQKEFMAMPIGKALPGVSDEEAREIINAEIAPILMPGEDPNSIKIESDSLTGSLDKPSYGLYREKVVGDIVLREPVINEKTGEPVRWVPEKDIIAAEKAAEFERQADEIVEQAKARRLKKLDEAVSKDVPAEIPKRLVTPRLNRTTQYAGREGANYYDLAKTFLGFDEDRHANVLGNFFKSSMGVKINPSKTAWCAAFANSVLEAHGIKGTGSLMARSFLKWGTESTQPKKGDIVVFSRNGRHSAYGHVGFFEGYDSNGDIRVLGGNQGDQVSIKTYSRSRLLGIRRPPSVKEISEDLGGK